MGIRERIRQALVGDLTSDDLPVTQQERDWQKQREQQESGRTREGQ